MMHDVYMTVATGHKLDIIGCIWIPVDGRSIDAPGFRRKTRRVPPLTPDERSRVGRALRRLREERDWKQEDIASKAEMSIGTVQNIEYNKHKVGRDNIDKYAAVFGTTAEKLLHPDPIAIAPSDSLLVDLNREHLLIARGYMRAVKAVRAAIEILVTPAASTLDTLTEAIAELVLEVTRASDRDPQIADWLTILLSHGDVLRDLARRLDADPSFEAKVLELLTDTKGKK